MTTIAAGLTQGLPAGGFVTGARMHFRIGKGFGQQRLVARSVPAIAPVVL